MPNLGDLNLNKFLYRESNQSQGDSYTPDSLNGDSSGDSSGGSAETDPSVLTSGELLGDLIMVDGFLRSKNYVATVAGWTINADGSVEFDNGYFRGDITGASGTFSGTITGGSFNVPDTTTVSSFHVDASGNAWWGTNVTTGYATAPAKILATGAATFTSISITGGVIDGTSTIGGRLASVLATAIDTSGHFADSAINTATGTIVTPFSFGASGAIQIGTYSVGVSGDLKLSPNGILARDTTGNTTFSINGTTGVAVLNGLVVGTNVGLGTAQDTSQVTTIIGNTVTTSFVNALDITAEYVVASIAISAPLIDVGTTGYIRGGQTDFNTGIGWFQGYSGGAYKSSMGNPDSDHLNWDGAHLKLKGSFDVGTGGLINNSVYTVATLPLVPIVVGFNNPSGNDNGPTPVTNPTNAYSSNNTYATLATAVGGALGVQISKNGDAANPVMTGHNAPSSLAVFQTLAAGANDGKIKLTINDTVYDNLAVDLRQTDSNKFVDIPNAGTRYVEGIYLAGQTFTTDANNNYLLYINHYTSKYLTQSANVYFSIYATSAGVPTGSPLKTITVNFNNLSNGYSTITYDLLLDFNTMYAWVVSFPTSDNANHLNIGTRSTGSQYAGGTDCDSGDSGGSWTVDLSGNDNPCQIYMCGVVTSYTDVATAAQVAIRAVTSLTETVAYSTDHFVVTGVTNASPITIEAPSTGTDLSGVGTTKYLDLYSGTSTGGIVYSSILTKTFTSTEEYLTYGNGSTELWGLALTGDDIDDTSFRLKISHNGISQIYKNFGLAIASATILTGLEVGVEAKYIVGDTSIYIDNIHIKTYYGTSILPVTFGSFAYVSDGRKVGQGAGAGTGTTVYFDGTNWCRTGDDTTVAA